jgi:hypothetical protein
MSALLGEIITWDIPGCEVPLAVMRQAIVDSGIVDDASILVTEIDTTSAFSRATKVLKKDGLIEKVKAKGGTVKYQLTAENNDGEKIDHQFDSILELDKVSGVVRSVENPKLASRASTLIAHALQHRNAGDINRLIQKLFRDNADLFPINPRKGTAYYVPIEHQDFTDKVEAFLEAMGGELHRWPIPSGTDNGNASVKATVANGMDRMVSELNAAADAWDDTTRKDTVERAQQRLELIEFKAKAYAEYLAESGASLETQIADARKRLAEKLFAVTKPEPNPDTGK